MKTSNAGPPNVAMKLFPFMDLHVGQSKIHIWREFRQNFTIGLENRAKSCQKSICYNRFNM